MIQVNITAEQDWERVLEEAELRLRPAAQQEQCGILVTRLSPGSYTVALDAHTPYGMTDMRDRQG